MKKRTKRIILVLTSLIVITFVITGIIKGDFLWMIRKPVSISLPVERKLDEPQLLTVDDYTIKMTHSYFEKNTGIGYFIFEVSKKDGDVETNMEYEWGNSFGDDMRFTLNPGDNICSYSADGVKEGDILKIYMKCSGISYMEDRENFAIYLGDAKSTYDEKIYCEHRYIKKIDVEETSEAVCINVSAIGKIIIAPVGMKIINACHSLESLVVYNKDGTGTELIIDGDEKNGVKPPQEYQDDRGNSSNLYVFSSLYDVENIEYIEFNGEKYYPDDHEEELE